MILFQSVTLVSTCTMDHAPAKRGADCPRTGAVAIRGDLVRGHASDEFGRAEESLGGGHIAALA